MHTWSLCQLSLQAPHILPEALNLNAAGGADVDVRDLQQRPSLQLTPQHHEHFLALQGWAALAGGLAVTAGLAGVRRGSRAQDGDGSLAF